MPVVEAIHRRNPRPGGSDRSFSSAHRHAALAGAQHIYALRARYLRKLEDRGDEKVWIEASCRTSAPFLLGSRPRREGPPEGRGHGNFRIGAGREIV